jgi:hypothetical protein
MAYSISEQISRDIDWFVLDPIDKSIHVASAGGRLPQIIADDDRTNSDILKEVRKLRPEYQFQINPNLNFIVEFESERMRELYLRDFIFMAERGFFSYDKTILGNFENDLYHLVAWPLSDSITSVNELLKTKLIKINNLFPELYAPFNIRSILLLDNYS